MTSVRRGRVCVAAPLLVATLWWRVLVDTHAFIALNVNNVGGANVRLRGCGFERQLHRRDANRRSSGVALLQCAQGKVTVAMSAEAGSTLSWSQAVATALAALQVCARVRSLPLLM